MATGRKRNQNRNDYSGIVGGIVIIVLVFLGIVLGPKIFNYYKNAVPETDSTSGSKKQGKGGDKNKDKKAKDDSKKTGKDKEQAKKPAPDSDSKDRQNASGKTPETNDDNESDGNEENNTGNGDASDTKEDKTASDDADGKSEEINPNDNETTGYSDTDFEDPAVREILMSEVGECVDVSRLSDDGVSNCFCYTPISDEIFARIKGKSYKDNCTVPLSQLCYVRVLHYGFDGNVHVGELIVNRKIADDVLYIFSSLFDAQYPIEKMLLVDEFDADDNKSMAANNSSSFNFRNIENTTTLSLHSYGLAIDINTLYNPYVVYKKDGTTSVYPVEGTAYTDRSLNCIYYIRPDDICVRLFKECGFTWGGDWTGTKDYQHFEMKE